MRNYFSFTDGEYVSGWRYFFRGLLQGLLMFFGIGFYLVAVTAYKRALSLDFSKNAAIVFAVYLGLVLPILGVVLNVAATQPGSESLAFVGLLANAPHWVLWFSNGKKQS